MRRAGFRAALLVLGLAAIALCGCGASSNGSGGGGAKTSTAALRLQREDLAAVAHALSSAEREVRVEVAATKAAWPLVANGLPTDTSTLSHPTIRAAAESAAQLRTPALLEERIAASITGPGSQLAGTFRNFVALSDRSWRMIGAAIEQIEHGSPASARFARANVDLYIETVYDAHFRLAQVGKQLLAAYEKLGGASAFGSSLTQQEADALARSYSEANYRLHPHAGVKLGS